MHSIVSADLNPLIVVDGRPVAVDALVEVRPMTDAARPPSSSARCSSPRGVVVAGASTHPGKFGFVALHNLLAAGLPRERCSPRIAKAPRCSASRSLTDIADLPDGSADLVFVCTPAAANLDLLRACAAKGIKAAFITSGRLRRGGARAACRPRPSSWRSPTSSACCWPARTARAWCRLRRNLCAQIVAPYPPAGRIGVASQSGNFVSSFLNYADPHRRRHQPGGVAPATRPRSPSPTSSTSTPTTRRPASALAYIEGVADGRAFFEQVRAVAARQPLVLVKGGATAGGQRAAASHTGSLATDDRVFDGAVPPGRDHPRRHRRGGLRGGRDVRHPAAPGGTRTVVVSPPPADGGWSPPTPSPAPTSS